MGAPPAFEGGSYAMRIRALALVAALSVAGALVLGSVGHASTTIGQQDEDRCNAPPPPRVGAPARLAPAHAPAAVPVSNRAPVVTPAVTGFSDFNGDGFPDLAVGVFCEDIVTPNGLVENAGAVHFLYGG